MKYAFLVAVLFFGVAAYLAATMSQPLIFVIACCFFPGIVQSFPYGLLDSSREEEDEPTGRPIGFSANLDERQ